MSNYSANLISLCSQSELWRLCAGEIKHNDYGIYDSSNTQAARHSENSANVEALPKTQTLPDL